MAVKVVTDQTEHSRDWFKLMMQSKSGGWAQRFPLFFKFFPCFSDGGSHSLLALKHSPKKNKDTNFPLLSKSISRVTDLCLPRVGGNIEVTIQPFLSISTKIVLSYQEYFFTNVVADRSGHRFWKHLQGVRGTWKGSTSWFGGFWTHWRWLLVSRSPRIWF